MEFIYKMAESIVNVISGSPETEKTNVREKETLERGQKIFDEITKHERRLEELEFGPIAQLTPLVIPFIACITALMLMGICCCGIYCFLGRAGTIGRVTTILGKSRFLKNAPSIFLKIKGLTKFTDEKMIKIKN